MAIRRLCYPDFILWSVLQLNVEVYANKLNFAAQPHSRKAMKRLKYKVMCEYQRNCLPSRKTHLHA